MITNNDELKLAQSFISERHPSIDSQIKGMYDSLKMLYAAIDFAKLNTFKLDASYKGQVITPLKMNVTGQLGIEREISICLDGTLTNTYIYRSDDDLYEKGEYGKFDGEKLTYVESLVKTNSLNAKNPFFLATVTYNFDGTNLSKPVNKIFEEDIERAKASESKTH